MHDLLLQDSPALDGLPGICCDTLLPLLLSASQVGFAGLCTVYSELLQRGVDGVVPGGVCFSALASAWNLFFSWRMKILFVLDSFSFFTSNCCWLALAGPFLLSFSFRAAVTRWCSVPTSASLLIDSDVLQRSSRCPVEHQVVDLVIVSFVGGAPGELVDFMVREESPSDHQMACRT